MRLAPNPANCFLFVGIINTSPAFIINSVGNLPSFISNCKLTEILSAPRKIIALVNAAKGVGPPTDASTAASEPYLVLEQFQGEELHE